MVSSCVIITTWNYNTYMYIPIEDTLGPLVLIIHYYYRDCLHFRGSVFETIHNVVLTKGITIVCFTRRLEE